MRLPALTRDENGAIRLYQPPSGALSAAPGEGASGTSARSGTTVASRLLERLGDLVSEVLRPGPPPLHAATVGDGCVEDNSIENPCEGDELIVEGEDPCDDELGYWDDAFQECFCYNGESWDDGCQENDTTDPPDDCSGCEEDDGGGGPTDSFDLSCDDATRGGTVTCSLSGSTTSVTGVDWTFTGGEFGEFTVAHSGALTSWSGTAVVGGTVTATVTADGGSQTTVSAAFAVADRSWSWGSDGWSHGRGDASAPASWDAEPDWDAPSKRGQLCSAIGSGCETTANPFIYPDSRTGEGYSVVPVGGGPNDGLWYVTSTDLGIWTKSWINDGYSAGWDKRALPEGTQAEECRTAMDLDPSETVSVNFNTLNGECKGKDMSLFVSALLDHEEDHHDMVTTAAAQTYNAPAQIEDFVGSSESELVPQIESRLGDLDFNLQTAGGASEPTGNWSSTVWMWKSSVSEYVESGVWSL